MLKHSNRYNTGHISNTVDSTVIFWVAAITTACRPSCSVFFYLVLCEKSWVRLFATKVFDICSCFRLMPQRLFTYHHTKCGLLFIFTRWKWNFGASKTKKKWRDFSLWNTRVLFEWRGEPFKEPFILLQDASTVGFSVAFI